MDDIQNTDTPKKTDLDIMLSYIVELNVLVAFILALVKEKKYQWVSVKDRLPETSGRYFAFITLGNNHAFISCLVYSAKDKRWNIYDCVSDQEMKKYEIKVTHWMLFPRPPTEQAGETGGAG